MTPKPHSTGLVRRIADHPALPALLQRIEARTLATMIERIGVEDSVELMPLIPAAKLLHTFDASIWKGPRGSSGHALDGDEFIRWLDAWHEVSEAFLLQQFESIHDEYLTTLFAAVLDIGPAIVIKGGDEYSEDFDVRHSLGDVYGRFHACAINPDHSDTLTNALNVLWSETPQRLSCILANLHTAESMLEASGNAEGIAADVRFGRERFHDAQGYANMDDARALFEFIRSASLERLVDMSAYDETTARHLRAMDSAVVVAHPLERTAAEQDDEISTESIDATPGPPIANLQALLENAHLIETITPALLLTDKREARSLPLEIRMRTLAATDADTFELRMRELVYLANLLMIAIRTMDQPLRESQARDAAFATCNLGLELLRQRTLNVDLATEPGLMRLFMIGWKLLAGVPLRVVDAFETASCRPESIARLATRPWLREQVEIGIDDLRREVTRREWDDARDAALFMSVAFDSRACRNVLALLDDLPRLPPRVAGEDFHWIETLADLERAAEILSEIRTKSAGK
jgi:Family of unknown function (DUF6178)